MLRTLPVDPGPLGFVAAGQPDPVMIWAEQDGRRVLTDRQETDEHTEQCSTDCTRHTGELLWTAYVLPTAAERPEVLQLRMPAKQQPVLTLFGPVDVVGLEVNVRVDKAGRLAQYWAAAEVRDAPQTGRKNGQQHHQEHKEGQPA
jgi:hypothetical protein